jgi:hypothetical protein
MVPVWAAEATRDRNATATTESVLGLMEIHDIAFDPRPE